MLFDDCRGLPKSVLGSRPIRSLAWQPVLDGDIISRRPIDVWKSGRWHKISMLAGFMHNEDTYIESPNHVRGVHSVLRHSASAAFPGQSARRIRPWFQALVTMNGRAARMLAWWRG